MKLTFFSTLLNSPIQRTCFRPVIFQWTHRIDASMIATNKTRKVGFVRGVIHQGEELFIKLVGEGEMRNEEHIPSVSVSLGE